MGEFPLSDIFYNPKNPIYTSVPGFQVNPAVFNADISPIFSSESVFFKIFAPVFNALFMRFYCFIPVIRMNMLNPYLRSESLKLFKTISCKFFNCPCPGTMAIFNIIIINKLSCLFSNYTEPFLTSFKNLTGEFSFSNVFYYPHNPVNLIKVIQKVHTTVLCIEVASVFPSEFIFFKVFAPVFHAFFMYFPYPFAVFRMNMFDPAFQVYLPELFRGIAGKLRDCSCPVN